MNKPANVKIRFEAISFNENSLKNVKDILNLLPQPNYYNLIGEKRILNDGRIFPRPNNKTLINFTSEYSVFDISEANITFLQNWIPYIHHLKNISEEYDYNFLLNFEITVFDLNYPTLIFKKEFIEFIHEINIELSFYFYND